MRAVFWFRYYSIGNIEDDDIEDDDIEEDDIEEDDIEDDDIEWEMKKLVYMFNSSLC